jgi:hypothetical protein
MYQIFGCRKQIPEQPMDAFEFYRVELLRSLWIEERVKRLAPVSPPWAILDETEVPFHVNAAA